MNRPPRQKKRDPLGDYRGGQIRARFDPDDRALIEGAWRTEGVPWDGHTAEQMHVVECIAYALQQFEKRLALRQPWPIVEGEWFIPVCQPATFFDTFVVRLAMQRIADSTGRGVALARSQPKPGVVDPKFGRCPDVIFP